MWNRGIRVFTWSESTAEVVMTSKCMGHIGSKIKNLKGIY